MKDHVRQGDVLTIEIDELPANMQLLKRENGAVILAHGEATGHAHAFRGGGVRMYATPNLLGATQDRPARVLRLLKTGNLSHEEHTAIPHDKGLRRVVRQTEWTDENEPIQVTD